jgi:hypothetical protein
MVGSTSGGASRVPLSHLGREGSPFDAISDLRDERVTLMPRSNASLSWSFPAPERRPASDHLRRRELRCRSSRRSSPRRCGLARTGAAFKVRDAAPMIHRSATECRRRDTVGPSHRGKRGPEPGHSARSISPVRHGLVGSGKPAHAPIARVDIPPQARRKFGTYLRPLSLSLRQAPRTEPWPRGPPTTKMRHRSQAPPIGAGPPLEAAIERWPGSRPARAGPAPRPRRLALVKP